MYKEDIDYSSVLEQLEDESVPLDRQLLSELSGPMPDEQEAFVRSFERLSMARQRELVARMVEYAEENFELDYTDLFRRLLDHRDAIVRRLAIEGLWEYERADLVRPLIKMLASDPDPGVRAAAATALGRFLFKAECDEISSRRGEAIRAALEQTIHDEGEQIDVIRRAVESIAYINDESIRRIIDAAYGHEDQRMQESALFAMGRSADRFWADTALTELHSARPAMRYEAAKACGEMQLKRAVKRLIQLAQSPDVEIQAVAVWALGQIGGKRARALVEHIIDEGPEHLRVAALDALDEMDFATAPLELMVHEMDDLELYEAEKEEEERAEQEDAESDPDEWPDEFLELG